MKIIAIAAVIGLAVTGYAATSNLDNHGIGDSAPTASTFVFRDANALFAAPTLSTTAIAALPAVAIGTIVWAQESVAGALVSNAYNLCVSTKAEAGVFVYVAVATSAAAVAGARCSN